MLGWVAGFDRQLLLPVFPVAIDELHGNRRADSLAVAHAGEDVSLVGLNLNPAAAAIALLGTPKLGIYEVEANGRAGGNSGDQRDESLAVGFTGSREANHTDSIVNARRRKAPFSGSRAIPPEAATRCRLRWSAVDFERGCP